MKKLPYYYIMAFPTTADVMQAEKYAEGKIKAAIMPLPHEISAGCGLALRFMEKDERSIFAFCKDAPLEGRLYKLETCYVDGHHPIQLIQL